MVLISGVKKICREGSADFLDNKQQNVVSLTPVNVSLLFYFQIARLLVLCILVAAPGYETAPHSVSAGSIYFYLLPPTNSSKGYK